MQALAFWRTVGLHWQLELKCGIDGKQRKLCNARFLWLPSLLGWRRTKGWTPRPTTHMQHWHLKPIGLHFYTCSLEICCLADNWVRGVLERPCLVRLSMWILNLPRTREIHMLSMKKRAKQVAKMPPWDTSMTYVLWRLGHQTKNMTPFRTAEDTTLETPRFQQVERCDVSEETLRKGYKVSTKCWGACGKIVSKADNPKPKRFKYGRGSRKQDFRGRKQEMVRSSTSWRSWIM